MTRWADKGVATIPGRMADGEKPYRVYKGGRTRGKVPTARRPEREPKGESKLLKPRGRPRWGRRIGLGVLLLGVLLIVWFVLGYLSFHGGVDEANARLPKTAKANLAPQDGMLISNSSLILLLGTDGDKLADARRSDSILLLRTDPSRHRMAYLSIPRDLRVEIPGYGTNKVNAAYQLGGPALTLKTVSALTGLKPNHVVLIDFEDFKAVIDAIGGIEIDVPKPILSNKFECPYATDARCEQWPGWRFGKGKQEMDGRRALIYSRIRQNRLDPADNDLTRTDRQQAVIEAMTGKLAGPGTFMRLPFIGGDLAKPLTTDLSAGQLLQLGWVKFRANDDRALHCRLGGESSSFGGQSVLIGGEENTAVLSMFTGRSAPQPPRPETTFGAGCTVGNTGS
jgi:polyisoprenyl-teichoic acid--peptidoglycan teichoic acid transferase